jgi:hypothetical protein
MNVSRCQTVYGGAITEDEAMTPDSSIPHVRASSPRWMVRWSGIAALSLAALCFGHWLNRAPADHSAETDFLRRFEGGTLVIAGGGQLPPEIRRRFLDLAGGSQSARIIVIPAFEADSKQIAFMCEMWRELGLTSIQVLQAASRDEANRTAFGRPLDEATGVWLSGGQQSLLSERAERRMKHRTGRGGRADQREGSRVKRTLPTLCSAPATQPRKILA